MITISQEFTMAGRYIIYGYIVPTGISTFFLMSGTILSHLFPTGLFFNEDGSSVCFQVHYYLLCCVRSFTH